MHFLLVNGDAKGTGEKSTTKNVGVYSSNLGIQLLVMPSACRLVFIVIARRARVIVVTAAVHVQSIDLDRCHNHWTVLRAWANLIDDARYY